MEDDSQLRLHWQNPNAIGSLSSLYEDETAVSARWPQCANKRARPILLVAVFYDGIYLPDSDPCAALNLLTLEINPRD